jgi:hypothetical protein
MTAEHEREAMLLPFLQQLLEQPWSPLHRKFDALLVHDVPVARCRECHSIVRAREPDASKQFPVNISHERWQSMLYQHLASHSAAS